MNLEKLPTLLYCEEVKEICSILSPYGINNFIFMRVFSDGSKIDLCTHRPWAIWHLNNYYQGLYAPSLIEKYESNSEGIELTKFVEQQGFWAESKQNFGIGNSFVIKKKYANSTEIFTFCADQYNEQINSFYLENLDALTKFTFFFKEKADKLLEEALRNPLPVAKAYKAINYSSYKDKKILFNDMAIARYYIDDMYITIREKMCLYWLAQGKTAEEIGLILKISKRTVEKHLHNIKNKTGCPKVVELITKLQAWKILEL